MSQLSLFTGLSVYDLPAPVQDDVFNLRRVFAHIVRTGEPAARHLPRLCDGTKGRTIANLYKRYKVWTENGMDDLLLVDKRKFPTLWKKTAETQLPAEFIRWASGRILGNQRKSKPAYRDILAAWRQWRRTGDRPYDELGQPMFPGYDRAPAPSDTADHPPGWSWKNLEDLCKLTKVEKALAREGSAAARKHVPMLTGTREGARWLEWIFFDDVWHDREAMVPGFRLPVRILQLGCLDYASATYLKFGLRPELPRDNGTRERLKRRDMLMLVAGFLLEHGYPTDYQMHLVVERATATLTQAEAQLLYDLSGGQIQVGYTSMHGTFVLAWQEASSGNADGKGPLESWHNLFHNYQGSLPGQTGHDRNPPAALQGSDREAIALTKAAALMGPDARARFRMPYPSIEEAHAQTLNVVRRINDRRDHALEDFGQTLKWRRRGREDWQDPEAILDLNPSLLPEVEYLPVLESPSERMRRLSSETNVAFIPPGALVRFFEDSHFACRIAGREATVTQTVDKKKTVYVFGLDDPEQMTIPEGDEVQLHFNPLDARFALVTHRSIFVGIWPRRRSRRGDLDAVANGIRRSQAYLNQAMGNVRGKMAEKLIGEQRRQDANLEVLASADLVPTSVLRDLAAGRQIVVTDVAAGMARAVGEIRQAEAETKAAVRSEADLCARAEETLQRRNTQSPKNHPENDDTIIDF